MNKDELEWFRDQTLKALKDELNEEELKELRDRSFSMLGFSGKASALGAMMAESAMSLESAIHEKLRDDNFYGSMAMGTIGLSLIATCVNYPEWARGVVEDAEKASSGFKKDFSQRAMSVNVCDWWPLPSTAAAMSEEQWREYQMEQGK